MVQAEHTLEGSTRRSTPGVSASTVLLLAAIGAFVGFVRLYRHRLLSRFAPHEV